MQKKEDQEYSLDASRPSIEPIQRTTVSAVRNTMGHSMVFGEAKQDSN